MQIEKYSQIQKQILDEVRSIDHLAQAFYVSGNDVASDRLFKNARNLEQISDTLKTIASEDLYSEFDNTRTMSGAIIASALASASVSTVVNDNKKDGVR